MGGGDVWRDIQPIVLTSEGSPLGNILCLALHCTFESNKKRSNKRERRGCFSLINVGEFRHARIALPFQILLIFKYCSCIKTMPIDKL